MVRFGKLLVIIILSFFLFFFSFFLSHFRFWRTGLPKCDCMLQQLFSPWLIHWTDNWAEGLLFPSSSTNLIDVDQLNFDDCSFAFLFLFV